MVWTTGETNFVSFTSPFASFFPKYMLQYCFACSIDIVADMMSTRPSNSCSRFNIYNGGT